MMVTATGSVHLDEQRGVFIHLLFIIEDPAGRAAMQRLRFSAAAEQFVNSAGTGRRGWLLLLSGLAGRHQTWSIMDDSSGTN
jgi:hypothetical protein